MRQIIYCVLPLIHLRGEREHHRFLQYVIKLSYITARHRSLGHKINEGAMSSPQTDHPSDDDFRRLMRALRHLSEEDRYAVASSAIAAWNVYSVVNSLPFLPAEQAKMDAFDLFTATPSLASEPPHVTEYAKQLIKLPETHFLEAIACIAPDIDLQKALSLDHIELDLPRGDEESGDGKERPQSFHQLILDQRDLHKQGREKP